MRARVGLGSRTIPPNKIACLLASCVLLVLGAVTLPAGCTEVLEPTLSDDEGSPPPNDVPPPVALFAAGIYSGTVHCDAETRQGLQVVQSVTDQANAYHEEIGPTGLPIINGREVSEGQTLVVELLGLEGQGRITAVDRSASTVTYTDEFELIFIDQILTGSSSSVYRAEGNTSIHVEFRRMMVGFDGSDVLSATQTCIGTLSR